MTRVGVSCSAGLSLLVMKFAEAAQILLWEYSKRTSSVRFGYGGALVPAKRSSAAIPVHLLLVVWPVCQKFMKQI